MQKACIAILYKDRIEMAILPKHEKSSGNVFADLGLANADELLLKAQIAAEIGDVVKRQKLTQSKAAEQMGVAQPDLSNLLRGQFKGFSVERMMLMLTGLGRDVVITVKPVPRSRKTGGITFRKAAA
jgi:predicted XRE-type DNA-binding protein